MPLATAGERGMATVQFGRGVIVHERNHSRKLGSPRRRPGEEVSNHRKVVSESQQAEISRMEERMCKEKTWELHKEVFGLEGSYEQNKAKFHVTHSLPSWLKKKRARLDEVSPRAAATKGHGWKNKRTQIKKYFARGPPGCAEISSLTVARPIAR